MTLDPAPEAPPRTLTIVPATPLLIRGHSAAGSSADTDVNTDPQGFPEIPQTRVESRLRDALLAGLVVYPHLTEAAVELLGGTGAVSPTDSTRLLRVGPARLDPELRAAAEAALDSIPGVSRENQRRRTRLIAAITDSFTVIDHNTAVDRSGAPVKGSLRATRVVTPPVWFSCDLRWTSAPSEPHLAALAVAVLGLRQLGARHTRGYGKVDCALDGDRSRTLALVPTGVRR